MINVHKTFTHYNGVGNMFSKPIDWQHQRPITQPSLGTWHGACALWGL